MRGERMGHLLNIDSNWTKKMLKKGMYSGNLNKGYILPHSLIVFKFKQFLFARSKYYCTACPKVKMNWDNVTKDYCSSRFLYRAWILDVMLIALVSNVTQLVHNELKSNKKSILKKLMKISKKYVFAIESTILLNYNVN